MDASAITTPLRINPYLQVLAGLTLPPRNAVHEWELSGYLIFDSPHGPFAASTTRSKISAFRAIPTAKPGVVSTYFQLLTEWPHSCS